jgi:hypothetical protein
LIDQRHGGAGEDGTLPFVESRSDEMSRKDGFTESTWSLNHNTLVTVLDSLPHIVDGLSLPLP